MESDKLAVLDKSIPIKSIPEEELNKIILTDFLTWLSGLLSLTDDISAERLKVALPAIKEHCWSMGFKEIKRMFEMYADNKLSIEPIPNYLDRIHLGKIVKAFKDVKRTKPKTMKYDKIMQDTLDCITHFDFFVSNRKVDRRSQWVYTYLQERDIIKDSAKDKIYAYNRAKEQKVTDDEAKAIAKRYLLRRFFENIEAKGKHLKDLI